MQARYYDPVIGRFYSNDPVDAVSHLGNEEGIRGFNRYSYAVNNPYKYTDPDGHSSELILDTYTKNEMTADILGVDTFTKSGAETVAQHGADEAALQAEVMSSVLGGAKVAKILTKPGDIKQTVENVSSAVESASQVVTFVLGLLGSPGGDATNPDKFSSGRGTKTRTELKDETKKSASVLKKLGRKK